MIFLVEDCDELRTALEELVGTLGYEVIAFAAAEPALVGLRQAHESPPDLLITDIRLPGMDGLELLERFRHTLPMLPVIVISSVPGAVVRNRDSCNAHTAFLPKPVRLEQLAKAIESATAVRSRLATLQSPAR